MVHTTDDSLMLMFASDFVFSHTFCFYRSFDFLSLISDTIQYHQQIDSVLKTRTTHETGAA